MSDSFDSFVSSMKNQITSSAQSQVRGMTNDVINQGRDMVMKQLRSRINDFFGGNSSDEKKSYGLSSSSLTLDFTDPVPQLKNVTRDWAKQITENGVDMLVRNAESALDRALRGD